MPPWLERTILPSPENRCLTMNPITEWLLEKVRACATAAGPVTPHLTASGPSVSNVAAALGRGFPAAVARGGAGESFRVGIMVRDGQRVGPSDPVGPDCV